MWNTLKKNWKKKGWWLINKVFLIGRLSKEIELRFTNNAKAVANTTIAVNRKTKEDGTHETDFINMTIWGNGAENLHKYCKKGSQISVVGRLQIRNYEDKDGIKRYITEVVAEEIQFLDTKKEQTTTNVDTKATEEQRDPFSEFAEEIQTEEQTSMSFDESELPF